MRGASARQVLQFLVFTAVMSCKAPTPPQSTSPFALNRLRVTGRVVDSTGAPLDGFFVAGGSRRLTAVEYQSGQYTTTGIDGRYSLELSLFADPTTSDSAAVGLSAQSQRASDFSPGGTPRVVRTQLVTRFSRPGARPDTVVVNFVVPFKR
jgi:hypothetical protein